MTERQDPEAIRLFFPSEMGINDKLPASTCIRAASELVNVTGRVRHDEDTAAATSQRPFTNY